jgi:hypothetical protein
MSTVEMDPEKFHVCVTYRTEVGSSILIECACAEVTEHLCYRKQT